MRRSAASRLVCACTPSANRTEMTMSLKYRIAATIFALEVVVIGAVLWITLGHSMRSTRAQIAQT